jgi:hypothetical protein
METYKNSYSVNEDEVLWELHEIRHELHGELKKRPLEEINRGARDTFERWKRITITAGKNIRETAAN